MSMDYTIDNLASKLYDEIKDKSNRNELLLDRSEVVSFYKNLRLALFINYYRTHFVEQDIKNILHTSLLNLRNAFGQFFNQYEDKIMAFYGKIDEIKSLLELDIQAMYDGDPAANSLSEIVLTYPGFIAISAYRIAHEFYKLGLKFLGRIITEYAHGRTGIDINPGATIGKSFLLTMAQVLLLVKLLLLVIMLKFIKV